MGAGIQILLALAEGLAPLIVQHTDGKVSTADVQAGITAINTGWTLYGLFSDGGMTEDQFNAAMEKVRANAPGVLASWDAAYAAQKAGGA